MATADADFAAMLEDCHGQFGDTVIYRSQAEGAFNTSTMVRTRVATQVSLTAIRSEIRMDPLAAAGTAAKEITFRVMDADLAGATPAAGDTVVDGSTTWWVHRVDRSVNGAAWDLVCRDRA